MRFTIGVVGTGAFACEFIPLFQAHPSVCEVCGADPFDDRVEASVRDIVIRTGYRCDDERVAGGADAVAIFAQCHLHGPLALKALRAGKHLYCAVPAAVSLDELDELVETVETSGLAGMRGGTSDYCPSAIYCRRRWKAGDFGRFVYGEEAYCHDMSHGLYDAFRHSGRAEWKRVAGFPPMFYPIHSTLLVLPVFGARMTSASCLGFRESHEDGIFVEGATSGTTRSTTQPHCSARRTAACAGSTSFAESAGREDPTAVYREAFSARMAYSSRHPTWPAGHPMMNRKGTATHSIRC